MSGLKISELEMLIVPFADCPPRSFVGYKKRKATSRGFIQALTEHYTGSASQLMKRAEQIDREQGRHWGLGYLWA